MDFISQENYDERLVDYILDEFISFRMVSKNLFHQNNNYSLCVIPKNNTIGYFMGLYHNSESIYEYSVKEGSYRFEELDKEFIKLFGQLDTSARKNKLVREFLGTNREKKLEKIMGKIEDDN